MRLYAHDSMENPQAVLVTMITWSLGNPQWPSLRTCNFSMMSLTQASLTSRVPFINVGGQILADAPEFYILDSSLTSSATFVMRLRKTVDKTHGSHLFQVTTLKIARQRECSTLHGDSEHALWCLIRCWWICCAVTFQLQNPMVIHVYHPYRQPDGQNYCQAVNGHCSHLCLPAPQIDAQSPKVSCACPDGLRLLEDESLCGEEGIRCCDVHIFSLFFT